MNFRLFWFVGLMTSMIICGILVVKLYDQLKNMPITISMDDKHHKVENVC